MSSLQGEREEVRRRGEVERQEIQQLLATERQQLQEAVGAQQRALEARLAAEQLHVQELEVSLAWPPLFRIAAYPCMTPSLSRGTARGRPGLPRA